MRHDRLLFGSTPSRWTPLIVATFALAGLLFAASATTAQTSARGSNAQNLADVVNAQNGRLDARAATVNGLRTQVQQLSAAQPQGSAVKELTTRGDALAPAAGLAAVTGPALTVTLQDSTKTLDQVGADFSADDLVIHQQDMQTFINAMWRGGAEAMMIQDQRVTSMSAVRCVGNTLILRGRVYAPPFVMSAIGDVDGMRKAIDADPKVAVFKQYVAAVGLRYDQSTKASAEFPAYDGSITLSYAKVTG